MSLILLAVWAIIGVLLGICFVIVVPWTAARIAGREYVEAVSDKYVWFAQTAARRSALVVRDGDLKLIAKRYDSDLKADKDSETGDERHHKDDFDVLGRLANKVFGFVLTSRDSYVSPLAAELGEVAMRAQERKEIGHEQVKGTADSFVDGIHIPKQSRLVDISAGRHLTTGSCEPEKGRESYEKAKISQEKFHDRVSFGQGMLLIIAALGSMGVAWFAASRTGGGSTVDVANQTTVGMIWLLASLGPVEISKQTLRKVAAGLWVAGWVLVVPVLAAVFGGPVIAVVVTGLTLLTPVVFLGGLTLAGPSIPAFLGIALARGFWILAQLTVGKGVLVERDTGELEHRQLRRAGEDATTTFVTTLSDGRVLPVAGSKGDLGRFAWAPMGFTAEKTEQNMDTLTEEVPDEAATDGGRILPTNKRQGYQPELREPDKDEWLVTLPQLWSWSKNTSESGAVRQGRNKALTEHGGEQQISMVVFFAMLLAAILMGGVFGLIAGGAIL